MPTFSAFVESKNKKGQYRVKILVTHKRLKKRIPTEWYLTKEDLTGKLKIKSKYHKDLISEKIEKYQKICDKIENIESMTVHKIAEILDDALQNKEEDLFKLDIITYLMSEYVRLLALGHKKKKSAGAYQTVANSLKNFTKRNAIDVKQMLPFF